MSVKISSAKTSELAEAVTRKPELTVVAKVIKGDTYMVLADYARDMEDEFVDLYYTTGKATNFAIIPPYNPKELRHQVTHNNVLLQCVQAMVVNVDGTGHEFVGTEKGKDPDKTDVEHARQFFDEPYPGESFVSIRKRLRDDLESIGWGYLEVLRTLDGEIVGLRHIEGLTTRKAKLGGTVLGKHKLMRGGKEITISIRERPRRFVQLVNGVNRQFFKEFGVTQDLDRDTGEWAPEGQHLPAEKRATELIAFGVIKDHTGPYHVPRWVNVLPSVVGSRKAEEQNLEFFDSGGMPPAIIFIQGGQMVGQAAADLRTYLSAANKRKGRAVVVELASNSGSLDSSGSVSAKVERFGAERANDAMFSQYDSAAEERVRIAFRLPPIFLGRAADYNYATAVVAYQVAEAQVFQPERTEFDEVINSTIIKAMGWDLKFKSLPITMKSVDEFFKGLELIKDKIEGEDLVHAVNITIGSDLKFKEPEPAPPGLQPGVPADPQPLGLDGKPVKQTANEPQPPGVTKPPAMQKLDILKLVRDAAVAEGFVEGSPEEVGGTEFIREQVAKMDPESKRLFDEALTLYVSPRGHGHTH
jgi:PBSX family phage portal protein